MNEFVNFWMKQPYEYRRAARFGTFPLNQPELPLRWEWEEKRPTPASIAIAITAEEESNV